MGGYQKVICHFCKQGPNYAWPGFERLQSDLKFPLEPGQRNAVDGSDLPLSVLEDTGPSDKQGGNKACQSRHGTSAPE